MNTKVFLCVDDDATVLTALRTLLSKSLGNGVTVEIAESGQEALEICEELRAQGDELSVVISDFIMPSMRGDELLVRLHEQSPQAIKIMLTGQSDVEGIKRAINEANLYRFLEKPFVNDDLMLTAKSAVHAYNQERELERRNAELETMNRTLEGIVAERTSQLLAKNKELERLSVTDRLTGVFNRLRLDHFLDEQLARKQRYGVDFSVVLLDVDHFKSVNDTYGHPVGDDVLVTVARLLQEGTREVDVVGRWGGEEFLVVCPDTSFARAMSTAEKIRSLMAEHAFDIVGTQTASFGVTMARTEDTVAAMLARADAAMYRSKTGGRNRVQGES